VNYQRVGANADWGQAVDADAWRNELGGAVRRLGQQHRVAFVCHDDEEERLAASLDPDLARFRPRSAADYQGLAAGAKAAIVSRLHAAIPLAGAGVSSLVVGTDSRLGAAQTIGLPTVFVKEATADRLVTEVEGILRRAALERARLAALWESTRQGYEAIVRELLP
jgi:hypothetical protein